MAETHWDVKFIYYTNFMDGKKLRNKIMNTSNHMFVFGRYGDAQAMLVNQKTIRENLVNFTEVVEDIQPIHNYEEEKIIFYYGRIKSIAILADSRVDENEMLLLRRSKIDEPGIHLFVNMKEEGNIKYKYNVVGNQPEKQFAKIKLKKMDQVELITKAVKQSIEESALMGLDEREHKDTSEKITSLIILKRTDIEDARAANGIDIDTYISSKLAVDYMEKIYKNISNIMNSTSTPTEYSDAVELKKILSNITSSNSYDSIVMDYDTFCETIVDFILPAYQAPMSREKEVQKIIYPAGKFGKAIVYVDQITKIKYMFFFLWQN